MPNEVFLNRNPEGVAEAQALGGKLLAETPEMWIYLPISPKMAREMGVKYYYGEKPCPHGHTPIRRVTSKGSECHRCALIGKRKYETEATRHARLNRARTQRKENPEKFRERERAWRRNNRAKVKAKKIRNKNAQLQATPTWLTEEQWEEMNDIYRLRDILTEETGIEHQVDHIIPLQGEDICGLHVPWNLEVLSRDENAKKSNNLGPAPFDPFS